MRERCRLKSAHRGSAEEAFPHWMGHLDCRDRSAARTSVLSTASTDMRIRWLKWWNVLNWRRQVQKMGQLEVKNRNPEKKSIHHLERQQRQRLPSAPRHRESMAELSSSARQWAKTRYREETWWGSGNKLFADNEQRCAPQGKNVRGYSGG